VTSTTTGTSIPSPAAASTVTRSKRSVLGTARRTAKDWLDRPMTSWHLITAIFFLLLGFGLLMVLAASSISSFRNNGGSPFATFQNQALFAGIGLVGFLFASKVSTRWMRTFSFPMVAVSLLLLSAVLAIGRTLYGATHWIKLGPIQFQPSEFAKLALLIWMGHVLAARRNTLRSLKALLIPVLPVFVIMVALIMLEPDLGTTVSLGIVFIAVLWFGGAPGWMFSLLSVSAVSLVLYLAHSASYRSVRVEAWLHPSTASADSVFQIQWSLYGLGHGGIFGAGLGQGFSKVRVPNVDSDFIFAVVGEQLGLVGASLVLILFGMLAYTGLRIARRNVDPFIKIVASAGTFWLVGQAVINIGYVIGLLPVTGITLPMMSRGGTSLVITMVVFGMLANFAKREPQAAAAIQSQGPGRIAQFLGIGVRAPRPAKVRKPRELAKVRPARNAGKPVGRSRSTAARGGERGQRGAAVAGARSSPGSPARQQQRYTAAQVTDFQGRSFVETGPVRRVDSRPVAREVPRAASSARQLPGVTLASRDQGRSRPGGESVRGRTVR